MQHGSTPNSGCGLVLSFEGQPGRLFAVKFGLLEFPSLSLRATSRQCVAHNRDSKRLIEAGEHFGSLESLADFREFCDCGSLTSPRPVFGDAAEDMNPSKLAAKRSSVRLDARTQITSATDLDPPICEANQVDPRTPFDGVRNEGPKLGGHSSVRLLDLSTQNGPRDIGTEFFAENWAPQPARLALDGWAPLSRNLALTAQPLADGGLLDPQRRGHGGLAAEAFDGTFDCLHGAEYRHCRCKLQAHCLLEAVPVGIRQMYTGKALGDALVAAMEKKGVTQAEVAAEFGIKQPSVSEWRRFGRIGKKHIPKLVEWFKDVVGPDHWGLPASWDTPLPAPDTLLQDDELELLNAYRLVPSPAKADIRAKAVQIALDANPAIAQMMEMAGVSRRADDASVLEWWHRVQSKMPRSQPSLQKAFSHQIEETRSYDGMSPEEFGAAIAEKVQELGDVLKKLQAKAAEQGLTFDPPSFSLDHLLVLPPGGSSPARGQPAREKFMNPTTPITESEKKR